MKIYQLVLCSFAVLSACNPAQKLATTPKSANQNFKNVMIASGATKLGLGPCEPSICINPTNPKNVAAGAILDANYWSMDGGLTWKTKKLSSDHGVFGDPVLIANAKGDFFYAHLSDPEGRGWVGPRLLDRIVVQRSSNGGETYTNGSFVGENHPKDQDKHWLVADPNSGHIYCTWTEFDKYASKDTSVDHSRILFAKSTDNGDTWSKAREISDREGDCLDDDYTTEGAVPTVGPNGEVYVSWAFDNQIWFDRSLDGGQTWLAKDCKVAAQPGGWTFDIEGVSRCNGLPITECDRSNGPHRGTIYVNWSDQRNGQTDTDIFVAKSTDGGQTWSQPIRINNDKTKTQQFLTWLTVDQTTGYLYCVFYDRRDYTDTQTDVYLAISKDGGQSFENIKISETPFIPLKNIFFGDYNHISACKGVVRPIWTRLDSRNGTQSVWTAIIDFK